MDCPHCNQKMNKCSINETFMEVGRGWGGEVVYICFNDECPYFVKGWKWMQNKYLKTASYRYAFNPEKNKWFPIPVAHPGALRDTIIE